MKGKRKAAANLSSNDAMEDATGSQLEDVINNHLGDEEEEEGEEEGEEEEEEEEEGEGEVEEEKEERPKLDEGFFEIEAIRRKRVRKGQLQYLIKWRGWPEAANTWEPLENLQSCSDVIDAFEESLQSGKSSRKRKRKHGVLHTQPKKKQPRSSATYNLSGLQASALDKTLPSPMPNNSSLVNLSAAQFMGSGHGENNGYARNVRSVKQGDQNESTSGSKQNLEKKDEIGYDPKLSELRGLASNNDGSTDEPALHFQEGKALKGDGLTNGLPKAIIGEPILNDRRTGAKRRKSGSVKRFQKDPTLSELVFSQNSLSNVNVGSGGTSTRHIEAPSSIYQPLGEDSRNASAITKIIKPIEFKASVIDDAQDVLVKFVAMRADGKEETVDNRFLKTNYPHLLINFYEQHLKYST